MSTLSISITGQDRLTEIANALAQGTATPAIGGAMTDAAYAYMGAERERFISASNGDGTWAPLAPSTIYKRLRQQGGADTARRVRGQPSLLKAAVAALRILYVTGELYDSLAPGAPGFFEAMDTNSKTVGTSDRKARWQHSGTATIPARPILANPDGDTLERMKSILASGYRAVMTGA